jgi:hypothetical protein
LVVPGNHDVKEVLIKMMMMLKYCMSPWEAVKRRLNLYSEDKQDGRELFGKLRGSRGTGALDE